MEYGKKSPQEYRTAQRERSERVQAIIDRDRAEKRSEAKKRDADIQVAKGIFANIDDTVVPPTDEWMSKGAVENFTPKAPDGTVRSVRTVRRVRVLGLARLTEDGKISDDLFFAAYWYRCNYDAAGVEGRYKTSSLGGVGSGGGGNGQGQHPMALHQAEAEARHNIRSIRNFLGPNASVLFDAIAIRDLPLRAAAREAACRNSDVLPRFRECCEAVIEWCNEHGVDLSHFAKNHAWG